MAGLGNLGGSLAMTLFGEREPDVSEEEATASRVPDPGLVDRVRAWLMQTPEAVSSGPEGPPAPAAIQQDPFWTLMGQQMRQAGMPGGTRVLDPATEAGATGMEAPPASPYARASELATYSGSALPGRGGVGGPRWRIPIPEMEVARTQKAYRAGKGKPQWYGGSPEAFEQMFGPDANLMRGFNAVLSAQTPPREQAALSLQALRLLKQYGIGGLERVRGFVSGAQKRELQGMADFAALDPKADLAQVLSPASLKRKDYYWSFGGPAGIPKLNRPVIDRHAGAMIYPGESFAQASGTRAMEMYERASELMNALAKRARTDGRQYQGASWIGWRIAKGLLKDNEPFAEILQKVAQASPDWQWLVKSGLLDHVPPEGLRNLAVAMPLTALALAGVLGEDEAEAASPGEGEVDEGERPLVEGTGRQSLTR